LPPVAQFAPLASHPVRPHERTDDETNTCDQRNKFILKTSRSYLLTSDLPVIHPELAFAAWVELGTVRDRRVWLSVGRFPYRWPYWELAIVLEVERITIDSNS
jgi:hypothetical protein